MIEHVLCYNKCGPMKRFYTKALNSKGKIVRKLSPWFYCPECLYDTSPIVGNKVHEVFGDLNPDPRTIKRIGNKWTSTALELQKPPGPEPESKKHFKFYGGKLAP